MQTITLLLCIGLFATLTSAYQGIGFNLLFNFITKHGVPMNVNGTSSDKYVPVGSGCTPYGYAYRKKGVSLDRSNPVELYYAASGQLTGFAVYVWNKPRDTMLEYWEFVKSGVWVIHITFRDPALICSGGMFEEELGDRVLVGNKAEIPLTVADAVSRGWNEGNCIGKMGIHYSFDTETHGAMSWNSSTLFPVMPMYNSEDHTITAILINFPAFNRVYPIGDWEGPFINSAFCLNWCSGTGCTFSGALDWTTMHFLFKNPADQTCKAARCKFFGEMKHHNEE